MSFLRGVIAKITKQNTADIEIAGDTVGAERFGQYGLFSKPKKGVQTLVLKRGDSMIIIGERDSRMTLTMDDGDVALFDGVNKVHLKRDGIHINAGSIILGDALKESLAQELVTAPFLDVYGAHFHTSPPGVVGGPTSPPTVPVSTIPNIKTTITKAA